MQTNALKQNKLIGRLIAERAKITEEEMKVFGVMFTYVTWTRGVCLTGTIHLTLMLTIA